MYEIDVSLFVAGLAAVLGLAGGALLVSVYTVIKRAAAEHKQQAEAISKLEEERAALLERLNELEKISGPKRLTHSQAAGLDDALAIALDILEENASSRTYTEARTRQLHAVLSKLREGPNSYPIEGVAGQRPLRRHENENV